MGQFNRGLAFVFYIFLSSYLFGQHHYKIPNYSGEHLKYNLKVGLFTVGEANIFFNGDSANCGSYIQATAKSIGFVKFLKDIEYNFNACMDPNTGLPITSTRIIREGDYTNNNVVYYFHNLRHDSSVVYSKSIDSVTVPKNIYDILTGFLHFRTNYLAPNLPGFTTVVIKTFFVDEVWDLTIRYAGKETIQTIFGKKECLKLMPVTEIGQLFKTENDMTIWFTNDKKMIPIKIHLDLKVGSLTAELKSYHPPKGKPKKKKLKN